MAAAEVRIQPVDATNGTHRRWDMAMHIKSLSRSQAGL
jgi:hypothetical protein